MKPNKLLIIGLISIAAIGAFGFWGINSKLDESASLLSYTCPTGGVTVTKTAQHCSMATDSANVVTQLWVEGERVKKTIIAAGAGISVVDTYPTYTISSTVSSMPVGMITAYAGTSAPTGYFLCDGSNVSRTTYSDLFSIISTTYGSGDGSTTFTLPNLTQRFPLGKASAGTGSTLGSTGGNIDHLHTVDPPNTTSGTGAAINNVTLLALGSAASPSHTHDVNISQFNSGTSNPPYQVVNYIIKY